MRHSRLTSQPARPARPPIADLLAYGLLGIAAALFLLPLIWLLITALKPAALIYTAPSPLLPWPPTLANFQAAWQALPFGLLLRNSLLLGLLAAVGATLSSSLAGYAFALLHGRGRRALFLLLLATMLLPPAALIVPSFLLFSWLGWIGSWLPLIVPQWCGNPFYILLFRQFFRSIPQELWDAAAIDGCGPLLRYWHIGLPLTLPAAAAVAIFAFVASWNDLLGPLVYLSDPQSYPLALGLAFFQGLYYNQVHLLAPLALVALIPPLLLCWSIVRLSRPREA